MPIGRRAHTLSQGQGRTAWTERLETEAVGITGLTTDDQDGTPEHGRHRNRRDFDPHHIHAVVVRKGHKLKESVMLTNPKHICDNATGLGMAGRMALGDVRGETAIGGKHGLG